MKYPVRRLPLLLATFVALRALVPVGYMLSLPADGSLNPALHLCPTQNPTLDLTLISAIDGSEAEHHGHRGGSGDEAGSAPAVAVSPDCNAWLSSGLLAVASHPQTAEPDLEPVLPPDAIHDVRARTTRSYAALPRAPPRGPA